MKWFIAVVIVLLIMSSGAAMTTAGNALSGAIAGLVDTLFRPNEKGKTLFGFIMLMGFLGYLFGAFKKSEPKKEEKK
ncbi:MAG: hypothetical protein U0469_02075 [Candidatus Paceibacterota bacterium]|jgi:hypothetical protein